LPVARYSVGKTAEFISSLPMSLGGRLPKFNKRRERTIASRSRRVLIKSHGRSKRWL